MIRRIIYIFVAVAILMLGLLWRFVFMGPPAFIGLRLLSAASSGEQSDTATRFVAANPDGGSTRILF